jgi:hypothetical protein
MENTVKRFVFEQNNTMYRGKPCKIVLHVAQSYYKTSQYTLSGYQF